MTDLRPPMPANEVDQLLDEIDTLGHDYKRLARAAMQVMTMLEDDGPSVVPHLVDTDDNPGQWLRMLCEDALAFEPKMAKAKVTG